MNNLFDQLFDDSNQEPEEQKQPIEPENEEEEEVTLDSFVRLLQERYIPVMEPIDIALYSQIYSVISNQNCIKHQWLYYNIITNSRVLKKKYDKLFPKIPKPVFNRHK